MRTIRLYVVIGALLATAAPALAHHSFSLDFDRDKPVTLNGTITKVLWTNPHVYTYIDTKDDKGKMTNWKIEMGSPSDLIKSGWTKTTLKPGSTVTIQGWRAKDGTNCANAEAFTMADGKQLSAASSHNGLGHETEGVATSGHSTPGATDKR
jgi:uncharacterized protein DUF6152